MLSYQHSYHAGSRADIHKHDILSGVLLTMVRESAKLTYIETHAGRGVYTLTSPEARKTGEAGEGWLSLIKDKKKIDLLSPHYVACTRLLNKGKLEPHYPGSPALAAHILRKGDRLHLMELHPAEHAALQKKFGHDKRLTISKRDGLEGALSCAADHAGSTGLLFIDPSYEVKSEYESVPEFVSRFRTVWPEAGILVWVPMLPAARHEIMAGAMKKSFPDMQISEAIWARPEDGRGMYGSIMMGINLPSSFQSRAASLIKAI